ncbi:ATPase [Clostridium oceanicum]|uniref:ATPase n=1 Tax=Clostridium oceanicum TaxID=1543 RepID=A0ABP3UHX3_9CLOT
MDVIKLLEYLQETIESASSIPLTGKVTINKKESLEVIDRVINCLPDEFKKAKWICEQKEKILQEAMEEAENMKTHNMKILKKQIENHNIIKEANIKSDQIINEAKKEGNFIRKAARNYADEILCNLEEEIQNKSDDIIYNIEKNLEAFSASLEESINLRTDVIKDNIKELRNMK